MYQASVYKIMIGAPSDIKEEIQIACQVINRWNNIHSESTKCILLPLHWSFSSYPSSGMHPQKILDKQLVEKSDLMLCFFGAKLGTATDTDISGTVEEINEHLHAGKKVMVFFRKQIDASTIDVEQFMKLKEYRQKIQDKVVWNEYNDEHDLESVLYDKLSLFVNDNWKGYEAPQIVISQANDNVITLSDWDKEHLKAWVDSGELEGYSLGFIGDGYEFVLGTNTYLTNNAEEVLQWEDFFERMLNIGFITLVDYDRFNNPCYRLKKAAMDYVKKFRD
jgi:hypothetical protein